MFWLNDCIGYSLGLVWHDALGNVTEGAEEAADTVLAALLWVEVRGGLVALGGIGGIVFALFHGLAELDETFDNVTTILQIDF